MSEHEVEVEIPTSGETDVSGDVGHEAGSVDTTGAAIMTVTSADYYQFEQETAAQIIGGFSALTFDLGIVIGLLLFGQLVRRWFV